MQNLTFSIILPVYNQAPFIADIIAQYRKALEKFPAHYEIILVVNGSKDNSLEVCQKLGRENPQTRVLYSPKNGWGLAVKLGIKEAKGDFVCYTNCARTQSNDLLLFLLYALSNQETVIKANRKIRESWRRRLGSLLYNLECRSLFDLSCWDINGTPKIFPRKFDKLSQLSRDDNLIDLEFNVLCQKHQYPLIEIPILAYKRQGGKSTTGYLSAFKMYWSAFQWWRALRANEHNEK